MLVLWEAGVNNKLFIQIYALNMKSNITVLTPYGPTEEFSVKDIVKQGTCHHGPILCSTSTGQYCTDKYSKSSGVFIGTQNVKPVAFVDNLIDPNRTVSDIIESNENAKHLEKIKRLTFKTDKCKSLYINYGKEQCTELYINGETAENVDAVKYLGDIFNSKGNNNDLIESRVKTGKQKIGVIQAFCKEIEIGNYEIQIMLQLYESIFLSTVFFNCQSQTNLTNIHIKSLQTLQMKYLKQTMCVPYLEFYLYMM